MPWVTTDLACPWYPVADVPEDLARDFPEQHAQIPQELYDKLGEAWKALHKLSDQVDEQRTDPYLKRRKRNRV